MSCLELGTRVPLIFKAPWLTGTMTGTASGALAELVDMYPTLSELAGLTLPTGPAGEYLGGTSLVPVLSGSAEQVKNCTISQFPRCCKIVVLSRFVLLPVSLTLEASLFQTRTTRTIAAASPATRTTARPRGRACPTATGPIATPSTSWDVSSALTHLFHSSPSLFCHAHSFPNPWRVWRSLSH